jgi:hypothetical protein
VIYVARTLRPQFGGVAWLGLHVHAAPAALGEGAGDRILARMCRANVDPEAVADVFERAPEHDVLIVLSIRNEGHVLGYPSDTRA